MDDDGSGNSATTSSPKKKAPPDSSMTTSSIVDCYWIVLATHVMNRLLKRIVSQQSQLSSPSYVKKHQVDDMTETAVVLSCLAHRMASILVSDKGRLEKACCATAAAAHSRSLLGRAILTATASCVWSLQVLTAKSSAVSSTTKVTTRSAIEAATIGLDRLVHLNAQGSGYGRQHNTSPKSSGTPTSTSVGGARHARALTSGEPSFFDDLDDLERFCIIVGGNEEQGGASEEELACLACLEGKQNPFQGTAQSLELPSETSPLTEEPPAKRISRRSSRPKSKKQASKLRESQKQSQPEDSMGHALLSKVFASLIRSTNSGMRMDGRVAVKRWASIALVWLCQGQARILRLTHDLLSEDIQDSDSYWLVQSTHIACRLLAIISESGNHCGLRPPTGGMEQYVRDILNDKRKKMKSVKADIRDWTTLVIYEVIQRHGRCLEQICVDGQPVTVVNDDSNSDNNDFDYGRGNRHEQSSADGSSSLEYFPNLHSLLHQLCRSAAASVGSSSYTDQSDWVKRLTTIAAAFAIQLSCRPNCPLDCKLTNFAMSHLTDALRNMEHNGTNKRPGGRDREDDTNNENEGTDGNDFIIKMFNLEDPLPKPQVPSVGAASLSSPVGGRGKKKQHQQLPSSASTSTDDTFSSFLNDPSFCTYAGVIPPDESIASERLVSHSGHFSDEHVVAHVLRAVASSSVEGDEPSSPASSLLSHLIEIIRRVYDTRTRMQHQSTDEENTNDDDCAGDEELETTRKADGKRGAKIGGGRKRKRQKTSKLSKTRGGSDNRRQGDKDDKNAYEWNRITPPRAMVATEALNALRFCLLIQRPKPASSLRQWIRQSLTTEQVGRIIHLGERLDRIVVKTRAHIQAALPSPFESTNQHNPSSTVSASSFFMSGATSNAHDFGPYEKDMWSAHMNMCTVLGCGQVDVHSVSGSTKHKILGDSDRRKVIYMSASASHSSIEADGPLDCLCDDDDDDKNRLWPLWLPAAQHALITANLIGEPIPISKDDVVAERFIVRTFVDSIGDVLCNIDTRIRPKKFETDQLCLDDEIQLSLRDARLFLLAFSRLPLEDKRYCFEELVSMLSKVLSHTGPSQENDKGSKKRRRNSNVDRGRTLLKRSNVIKNKEASGFLARVLVTCSSMVHMLKAGVRLRDLLFGILSGGSSSSSTNGLSLPSFFPVSEWYRSERCFMGVFADWEAPGLPADGPRSVPARSTGGLNDSTIQEWKILLRKCFSLGFASAQHDKCHLLFAAWNGLGSSSFLDRPPAEFPRLGGSLNDSNEDEEEVLSERMLQLRDDMCSIHLDISSGNNIDAPRSSTVSSSRIKMNLRTMMVNAEKLLDSILNSHGSTADEDNEAVREDGGGNQKSVPVAVFALLLGISSYVAACVSAHTKPGNDYFSATLSKAADSRTASRGSTRRQRGYSSESDRIASDGDSVETDGGGGIETDARVDALSRLRECCDAFGAAPIHPDWLDVSCRFREGISPSDATEIAEMALRCLTKLVVASLKQYKWNQYQGLKILHPSNETQGKRVALGLNLCQWSNHEPAATSLLGSGPYPDDREWKDDVSSVCGLQPKALELLMKESAAWNVEQSKDAWCPNSAQRLVGRLQDRNSLVGGWETSIAELRAGGEWELLLSESLTVACLDINSTLCDDATESASADDDAIRKGREAMVVAHRWRTVFVAATSHLMPAAALLRLGLGKVGRKPHPFCFHENNQDPYDVAPIHFSEALGLTTAASTSLKKVVFDALTTLTRVCVEGDDALIASCHAIASHLVIDSKTFNDLEGLQSVRFALMGLSRLRSLVESSQADAHSVVPFVAERLISVIEDFGRKPNVKGSHEFSRLLAFFGTPRASVVDTVVQNDVDSLEILTKGDVQEVVENESLVYHWNAKTTRRLAISEFTSIVCRDSLNANEKTRSCLAFMLSRIAHLESRDMHTQGGSPSDVACALNDAFNSVGDARLKDLILQDLCCLSIPSLQVMSELPQLEFRKDLGLLLVFLLAYRSKSGGLENTRLVLDTLVNSFASWSELDPCTRAPILDVLLLYSARFDSLKDVGARLIARASSASKQARGGTMQELEPLTKFLGFVRDLRVALSTTIEPNESRTARKGGEDGLNQGASPVGGGDKLNEYPLSCSFVQKSGFHGQHWYNCYTCGLVWDKGCCTLCALVCHRGHDVSYSRYSSFFCDCGAEDGGSSTTDRNRVSCKCLSSLPRDKVESIFSNELKTSAHDSHVTEPTPEPALLIAADRTGIEVARSSFKNEALSSIESFLSNAMMSTCADSLFAIMQEQFEEWKKMNSTKLTLDNLLLEGAKEFKGTPKRQLSHEELSSELRKRRAKALDLQPLAEKTLGPVRAAKGFQVKMSTDSSTNARLVAQLSKHEIIRTALVADSRGRVVVTEPSSLVFCSMIPAVSVRYINRPFEPPLSRSQMCILGSSSVKFSIVGLRLCQENERHLVVWGTSDACVVIVKPNWDGVEEKIDLVFDLEQQEGEVDYLVKCEWIPGSQTHVTVGCGRFVRIYDISRKAIEREGRGGDSVAPVIGYNLGFESGLRDMSIVPDKRPRKRYSEVDAKDNDDADTHDRISKLFLLLENGRLHVVNLKTTANGKLESPGDQHFEPSECVTLKTDGVRSRMGSPLGQAGSSSHSLGEGSRLAYLKQSRVLLYKCATSCVLALMLNKKGDVEGTFELLPHSISGEALGETGTEPAVTGPFTHWVELGVAYRGGSAFFRVACVGKSPRTNQSKLLCIEFNEKHVKIRELSWPGLTVGLSLSCEGLAAFSAPYLCSSDEKIEFGERAYLCSVTSDGSMLCFGEELVDAMPASRRSDQNRCRLTEQSTLAGLGGFQAKKPTFPLTLFETLKNVSESNEVAFGGEGLGR